MSPTQCLPTLLPSPFQPTHPRHSKSLQPSPPQIQPHHIPHTPASRPRLHSPFQPHSNFPTSLCIATPHYHPYPHSRTSSPAVEGKSDTVLYPSTILVSPAPHSSTALCYASQSRACEAAPSPATGRRGDLCVQTRPPLSIYGHKKDVTSCRPSVRYVTLINLG
jgi:hypothetical protein